MSVKTTITVDNRQLQQGMQQAEQIVNQSGRRMQQGVNGATNGMNKFGQAAQAASQAATGGLNGVASALSRLGPIGAVAAAAIVAIGMAAKKAWDFLSGMNQRVDSMAKAAKSVNISTDAYLGIAYAAKAAGIETQKILNIITRLDQAVAHAADGNRKYIDAFAQLGIYWRDLENMSPEQKLLKLIEQMRKFKEEGRDLPSGLADLVGRRDVPTMNKAVADGFDKKYYSAAMEGFGIDPGAIAAAEQFTTAMGALNQRFVATVTQMKAFGEATKWVTEQMNGLFKGGYKVDVPEKLRETVVSYGEAVGNSLDTLNEDRLIEVAKALVDIDPQDSFARTQAERGIELKKGVPWMMEELKKQLKEQLGSYDARAKLSGRQAEQLYKFVQANAGEGKLFDEIFASSKVKLREKKDNTSLSQDIADVMTKDQRDRLMASLEEESKKAQKIIDSAKERRTVEQRINDLIKERARLLPKETKEQREQVRLELQLKAIEAQRNKERALIATLQERSQKVQAAAFGNIFATLGYDKSMMDSLLEGYSSTTGKDAMTVMNDLIRSELYNRELKGGKWNGEKIPEIENASFSSLLQSNPGLLADVVRSIGGKMSSGTLDYMITTDAIKTVERELLAASPIKFYEGLKGKGLSQQDMVMAGFNPENATNANQISTMKNIDLMLDFYKEYMTKFENLQRKEKANNLTEAEAAELKQMTTKDSAGMTEVDWARWNVNHLTAARSQLVPAQALAEWQKQNVTAGQMAQGEQSAKMSANLTSLQTEYELQKAIIAGDEEQIRLLEKKQMLQKMGLPADEATLKLYNNQLEALLNQEGHLKNQSLLKNELNKLDDMGASLLEKQGRGREAAVQRALSAAKRSNGGKDLSPEAMAAVEKVADLEYRIANFQMLNRKEDVIHANELAQRGGFNSSVVVERKDNTKMIIDQIKQLLQLDKERTAAVKGIQTSLGRPG